MAGTEGYGADFEPWDVAIREKFKAQIAALGTYSYHNFEIFLSPKGRWMAFFNTGYGDIKVVDLESGDVVATDVYSKKEPKFYGEHANYSTFVPSYFKTVLEFNGKATDQKRVQTVLQSVADYDDSDFATADWSQFISVPMAFNAWTIWAADTEFYVDVLDLRKIDDGVISVWDEATSFVIPREAAYVRNYVKFEASYWIDLKPHETRPGVSVPTGTMSSERGEFSIQFDVLEERSRDRATFNIGTHDVQFVDNISNKVYAPRPELPWETGKRRWDAYMEKHKTKAVEDKTNGQN